MQAHLRSQGFKSLKFEEVPLQCLLPQHMLCLAIQSSFSQLFVIQLVSQLVILLILCWLPYYPAFKQLRRFLTLESICSRFCISSSVASSSLQVLPFNVFSDHSKFLFLTAESIKNSYQAVSTYCMANQKFPPRKSFEIVDFALPKTNLYQFLPVLMVLCCFCCIFLLLFSSSSDHFIGRS